jgi:hypothetical protein
MELIDLSTHIIYDILNDLSLKELIKMEQVNKKFINIIRNGNWLHTVMTSEAFLIKIITQYKFIIFSLSFSDVTNESVKMLSKCHTLYLSPIVNK